MKKIRLRTVLWSAFKLNFLQASWNFERLQNTGFLFSVFNILKRIYRDDRENMLRAVNRHLNFFNTHIFFSSAVLGVIARLEEEISNDDPGIKDAEIESTKLGIMGPMAAIGDSLFWSGLRPFCLLIGAGFIILSGYTVTSFYWGAALSFGIYSAARLLVKYYLLIKAYYNFKELFILVQKVKFQDIMRSIKLIGMGILGGVFAGYLALKPQGIIKARLVDSILLVIIFSVIVQALRRKTSVSHIFAAIIVMSVLIEYII